MRYGVIADVHGNLPALESVLAFLADERVDGYLCAGDLVGYGPLPNECVHRVVGLPATCVAGNHDLIALGRLGDERCGPLARRSLRWTRAALDGETRAALAALPLRARGGEVTLCHATLGDPREYVLDEPAARACLAELAGAEPDAAVLLAGHTHHAMAVGERRGMLLRDGTGMVPLVPGERIMLNPGAVGQSRTADPRARALVLDTTAGTAAFHALPYDIEACRRALRERGLPPGSHHLAPSRWRTAATAVRRRFRPPSARRHRA